MKESDRLRCMAEDARREAEEEINTTTEQGWIISAALLEIARQIAITREEAQNGKSSPFDRR